MYCCITVSEEEYIDAIRPIYKRRLTIGNYKNDILKPIFLDENKNIPIEELDMEFENYFLEYKEDLFTKAKRYKAILKPWFLFLRPDP